MPCQLTIIIINLTILHTIVNDMAFASQYSSQYSLFTTLSGEPQSRLSALLKDVNMTTNIVAPM